MKITNKIYNINGNINTKLVLISDIHYYNKSNIKVLNKILDLLRKINPNYICIPGDIIDNSNILDEKYLIEWLRKLANISKVIISVGNHEYYIDKKNNKFGANIKLMNKIKKIFIFICSFILDILGIFIFKDIFYAKKIKKAMKLLTTFFFY